MMQLPIRSSAGGRLTARHSGEETGRKRQGGRKRREEEEGYWEAMGEGSFRNEWLNLKPVDTFQPVKADIQITVLAAVCSSWQVWTLHPSLHPILRTSVAAEAWQKSNTQLSIVVSIRLIYRTCVRADYEDIDSSASTEKCISLKRPVIDFKDLI